MSDRNVKRGHGHGPMGGGPVEKAKDFKKSGKRLITQFAPFKIKIIAVLITSIIAVIFNILSPKILGTATDAIVEGISTGLIDFGFIKTVITYLVVMYALSALFTYFQEYIMASVSQNVVRKLRTDVSDKINNLPLKYFDENTVGDILSRVTNDSETIGMTLQRGVTQVITSFITVVGIIAIMLTISPILTVITLVSLPLSVFAMTSVMKRSQSYFKEQQKKLGQLNGHVEEMYSGHLIIKAYGKEEHSIDEFEKINKDLSKTVWKAQFLSGLIMPINNLISNLGYVLISIVGAVLGIKGTVSIGSIQAFLQYNKQFSQPISQLGQIMNQFQSAVAAAERVFEVLDELDEVKDNDDAVELKNIDGEIKFDHVQFGYKEDNILIKDMNITALEGQTVAIVGPTGAGKTTLVNLIMRFYEVNSGKITIDGTDVKNIKRNNLRKNIGMVLQDTWLFNGTIKENIAYGREDANDKEIITASKIAQAHHFIQTLPDGYNTVLNEEGTNLSQGQKQLLTIARAFLSDPSILILDEATSSIDTRTEIQIQNALSNLMYGRTSFVIAHRLSTIKNADLILVMNHGDVIESGTHEELLNENGFYADLYNSQFNS
ncbi:MAG: ABC transporter ATP-binding protein [Sedimentibacter sp.]